MIWNSMGKAVLKLLLIVFLVPVMAGCVKPCVGRTVHTRGNPYWCYRPGGSPSGEGLPFESCVLKDEWFEFTFTVRAGEKAGEYVVEGFVDGTQGGAKSWSHLVPRDSRFSLLVARDDVIVDNVCFHPQGDSLSRKLPFRATITGGPFDALTVDWKVSVRGGSAAGGRPSR